MNINNTEPVAVWGTVGMLVGLAIQRWLIPDMQDTTLHMIAEVAAIAIPTIIGLVYARSKVTPVGKENQ